MNLRRSIPIAVGFLLAASAPARAQMVTTTSIAPPVAPEQPALVQWEVTLGSTGRWQFDNGDRTQPGSPDYDPTGENFGDVVSTLGASATAGELVAAVRIDEAFYAHHPIAAPGASQLIQDQLQMRYVDQLQLEYLSLSYSDADVEATVGDYYVTLGRGMVLAIRKVDDLGIDNKLRGGEARAHMGPLTAHAFLGLLNVKNYEAGTGYAFDDPNDLIAGGRVEYGMGRYFKIGAHAARIVPKRLADGTTSLVNGYGATLELPRPVPFASFYAEVARLERTRESNGIGTETVGHGAYASLDMELGPTTVLIEAKYYDDLFSILPAGQISSERQGINRLTEPPSAERPLALLLSNETVHGARIRVDLKLIPELVPYVSAGRYRDGRIIDSDITVLFAGARGTWSSGHASVEGGYRGQFVAAAGDPSDGRIVRTDSHLSLDLSQAIAGPFSVELNVSGLRAAELQLSAGSTDWLEGRAALSLASSDRWSVTGAWEWYTKTPEIFDVHYFSIGGQWEITTGWLVRGLYGGERAGLKCAGGVCRFFPGFEGGRLELQVRI